MSRREPSRPHNPIALDVDPSIVLRLCIVASVAFVSMSFLMDVLRYSTGLDGHLKPVAHIMPLLDLDEEASFPTIFSYAMLLSCSGLTYLISRLDLEIHAPRWIGLSLLFVLLAFDEALMLHEKSMKLSIGLAMVILVATGIHKYPEFLRQMPGKTLGLLVAAGLAYLSGALAVDAIADPIVERRGRQVMAYRVLATLEEALEFLGIILAIAAIRSQLDQLKVGGFCLASNALVVAKGNRNESIGPLPSPMYQRAVKVDPPASTSHSPAN